MTKVEYAVRRKDREGAADIRSPQLLPVITHWNNMEGQDKFEIVTITTASLCMRCLGSSRVKIDERWRRCPDCKEEE